MLLRVKFRALSLSRGKAVKVHGLGDAAFKASTAFDAAGAATTAETNAKNMLMALQAIMLQKAQGSKADQVFAALTGYSLILKEINSYA